MREAVAAFFVVGTDSQSRAATVMEKKKGASSRQIRELRWHAAAQDEIKGDYVRLDTSQSAKYLFNLEDRPMAQWLWGWITSEWGTVMRAPILLGLVFVLGAVLGCIGSRIFYEQDLQTLRDHIALYEAKPTASPAPVTLSASLPSVSPSPSAAVSPSNPFAGPDAKRESLLALSQRMGWPKGKKLKEVYSAHYVGIEVPLDGYVYYDSIFDRVTFRYEGKLPSGGWVDSRVSGSSFDSGNPAIKTAFIILQSLNFLPSSAVSGCGLVPAPPPVLSK